MSETHPGPDELHVRVIAPSERQPREFNFPKTQTVGDAATIAATAFGLHPTAPSFELERSEQVLDRTLTLDAAGVRDGELLELVDVGGGV